MRVNKYLTRIFVHLFMNEKRTIVCPVFRRRILTEILSGGKLLSAVKTLV